MVANVKVDYFETRFGGTPAYTFNLKVKDLVLIHYIAVRGQDDEPGAVQRVLNKRRIESIKDYVLSGNQFFSSFILNWANADTDITFKNKKLEIPLLPASAQVIDGQHRISGLEAAMIENSDIGEQTVIVTLCNNLDTTSAAKIFLNINTEQKPVPKSLIYDLFGEIHDDFELPTNRAVDIARALNDDQKSPLYNLLKFPGAPRGKGRIELSTFVNALKPHLEKTGKFNSVNITSLQHQTNAILNYFSAIERAYSSEGIWTNMSKNPFFKAAGFYAAIEFFAETILMKCAELRSFEVETIQGILSLKSRELLIWEQLKGTDGKTARKMVKEYLAANLTTSLPDQDAYKF